MKTHLPGSYNLLWKRDTDRLEFYEEKGNQILWGLHMARFGGKIVTLVESPMVVLWIWWGHMYRSTRWMCDKENMNHLLHQLCKISQNISMWRPSSCHALQFKLYYLSNNFTQGPLILTASIKCYKNAPQCTQSASIRKRCLETHWAHVTGNEKQYVSASE